MKKYEITREVYNPCANIYNFDMSFQRETFIDNFEDFLEETIGRKLPKYNKSIYDDGKTIEFEILLPRKERYTFSESK